MKGKAGCSCQALVEQRPNGLEKKALLAVRSWVSGEWKPTQGECLKLDIPLNGLSFRKADMAGGRRLDWGRVGKPGGLRKCIRTPKKDIKTKSSMYLH